jgi:hypothetical protein
VNLKPEELIEKIRAFHASPLPVDPESRSEVDVLREEVRDLRAALERGRLGILSALRAANPPMEMWTVFNLLVHALAEPLPRAGEDT